MEKIGTTPLLCRNRSVRKWHKFSQDNVLMFVFCVLRKPSGRQEVVQLMRMMDDMLLKAGVDEHTEELTEISQVRRQMEVFLFDTIHLTDTLLFLRPNKDCQFLLRGNGLMKYWFYKTFRGFVLFCFALFVSFIIKCW